MAPLMSCPGARGRRSLLFTVNSPVVSRAAQETLQEKHWAGKVTEAMLMRKRPGAGCMNEELHEPSHKV